MYVVLLPGVCRGESGVGIVGGVGDVGLPHGGVVVVDGGCVGGFLFGIVDAERWGCWLHFRRECSVGWFVKVFRSRDGVDVHSGREVGMSRCTRCGWSDRADGRIWG